MRLPFHGSIALIVASTSWLAQITPAIQITSAATSNGIVSASDLTGIDTSLLEKTTMLSQKDTRVKSGKSEKTAKKEPKEKTVSESKYK